MNRASEDTTTKMLNTNIEFKLQHGIKACHQKSEFGELFGITLIDHLIPTTAHHMMVYSILIVPNENGLTIYLSRH